MGTDYTIYQAQIPTQYINDDVRRMLQAIEEDGIKVESNIYGAFFEVQVVDDDCWSVSCDLEGRYTPSLMEFNELLNSMLKNLKVSLSYVTWWSTHGGGDCGCYCHDYDDSDEKCDWDQRLRGCPTLVLAEVLAKRLES